MAIELPSGLAGLFKVLTGMAWPQGNEDTLREVGTLYTGTANDFDQLADLVTELTAAINRSFEGDTATAFVSSMKDLVGGQNYIGTAKDGAAELAQFADDTANQIEYMKWMILGTLIELAAELAFYAATAWFNWGAPAEAAAAEVAARLTIQAVVRSVLKYLLQHVALGLATALAMDGLIQYIQIRQHHRAHFDGHLTLQAVEFAGISSVLGAALGPLGNKFGSVLGDFLGRNFGKDVGNDLGKIFAKGFGSLPADGAKDLGNDLGRALGDNGRGLASGFTKDIDAGAKAAGDDLDHEGGEAFDHEGGETFDGKVFDEGAANAFSHDMGEVFSKHLGDTLGKDEARDLGRDFADEFVDNWGHHDLDTVKNGLHDLLSPFAGRLGEDGVRALSHDLPDVLLNNMVKSTGQDVGRKVGELVSTSLTSGVNMTLTTGFYNLIFGPDHSFETSFGAFGGGAAMGALGHGGRMAIDHFSPHIAKLDVPDFNADFGKGLKFGDGTGGLPGAPRPDDPEPGATDAVTTGGVNGVASGGVDAGARPGGPAPGGVGGSRETGGVTADRPPTVVRTASAEGGRTTPDEAPRTTAPGASGGSRESDETPRTTAPGPVRTTGGRDEPQPPPPAPPVRPATEGGSPARTADDETAEPPPPLTTRDASDPAHDEVPNPAPAPNPRMTSSGSPSAPAPDVRAGVDANGSARATTPSEAHDEVPDSAPVPNARMTSGGSPSGPALDVRTSADPNGSGRTTIPSGAHDEVPDPAPAPTGIRTTSGTGDTVPPHVDGQPGAHVDGQPDAHVDHRTGEGGEDNAGPAPAATHHVAEGGQPIGGGRDFVPAPHWAPHDDERNAAWQDAQRGAADRRDGELHDAARAFGRERRFEDVHREWSESRPGLRDDVRDRVREQGLADQRHFGANEDFGARTAEETRKALDRHRAVEEGVDRVKAGFDAAFLNWAGLTGRLEGGGEHTAQPADPHAGLRDLVREDPDAAGRVHQTAWEEADHQVRLLAGRLTESALDAPPERITRQAERLTAAAGPGLHELFARAARDDVRRTEALDAFDRAVPDGRPGAGEDGRLSEGGRERLRTEWEREESDDRREILGELSATPGWRKLFGGTGRAARAEEDHGPDREERDQHAYEERRARRAAELPGRVELQLAKESAARGAVDVVREVSEGSWKQASRELGAEFTDAFGLDAREARDAAQRDAARTLGQEAHTRLDRWAGTGDEREPAEARDIVTDALRPEAARRAVAVAVAREAAADRAGFEARELAAREAPLAPPDAVDRFAADHQERVKELFDGTFGPHGSRDGESGEPRPSDERMAAWRDGRDALSGELAHRLRFETSATSGLSHWAEEFHAAADGHEVPEEELARIGEQTRRDWFTAYRDLWGPEDLDANRWLDHEADNGGRFDADHPDAEHPEGGRPDDTHALVTRTTGGRDISRPPEPGRTAPDRTGVDRTEAEEAVARRVFDADELPDLAADVRRAVDEEFAARRRAGADPDDEGMQWCVAVVAAFRDRVFPVPEHGVSGVRSAAAAGDEVLGLNRTADRLAPGAGWRPVGSWADVSRSLAGKEPGGLAMGLTRSPFGRGHAVVAYRPRGTGGQDSAPVWVEMSADGDVRVSTEPPDTPPIEAVALVVDHSGKADPEALEPFVASSSTQHALLDPTSDRRFGAPSSSSGLGGWRNLLGVGAAPERAVVSHGTISFANLSAKHPEYVAKATRLVEMLGAHDIITRFLGGRQARIVLEKRTTESPAEVVDRDDGVTVRLAAYYFEKYDIGYVAGMLSHEFGIHPVAQRTPHLLDEEDGFRGMPFPVPGLEGVKEMNSDTARQADHVLGAIPRAPRFEVFKNVTLDMAKQLFLNALRDAPDRGKPQDITDLFDTYLMDLASIAATNDNRLLGLPSRSGSSQVRDEIATAYNAYKQRLAADPAFDPRLEPFLPPDKTGDDVKQDFLTLAARAGLGMFSAPSISHDPSNAPEATGSGSDVPPSLPEGWSAPVVTQGGQPAVRTADGDLEPPRGDVELTGSGEVRTDRWIPFGGRGGGPEAFEFTVSPDGTPTGVRRPPASGERTEVGYAWRWEHGDTPAGDVLRFTRRIHLRSAGATRREIERVKRDVAGAVRQLVDEPGHRLPVGQPDVVTGPRRPGPLWRAEVEFVDSPEAAHSVVAVRGGLPERAGAMVQGVWYAGVDPAAYGHEVVHGFGVWDDQPDPRALLTPGGRGEQVVTEGGASLMAPVTAETPRPLRFELTPDHLRQVAEVFAPHFHPGSNTSATGAGSPNGTHRPDVEPAALTAVGGPDPLADLLRAGGVPADGARRRVATFDQAVAAAGVTDPAVRQAMAAVVRDELFPGGLLERVSPDQVDDVVRSLAEVVEWGRVAGPDALRAVVQQAHEQARFIRNVTQPELLAAVGDSGHHALSQYMAESADALMAHTVQHSLGLLPQRPRQPFAVLAVGGYGRMDMTPAADLDFGLIGDAVDQAGLNTLRDLVQSNLNLYRGLLEPPAHPGAKAPFEPDVLWLNQNSRNGPEVTPENLVPQLLGDETFMKQGGVHDSRPVDIDLGYTAEQRDAQQRLLGVYDRLRLAVTDPALERGRLGELFQDAPPVLRPGEAVDVKEAVLRPLTLATQRLNALREHEGLLDGEVLPHVTGTRDRLGALVGSGRIEPELGRRLAAAFATGMALRQRLHREYGGELDRAWVPGDRAPQGGLLELTPAEVRGLTEAVAAVRDLQRGGAAWLRDGRPNAVIAAPRPERPAASGWRLGDRFRRVVGGNAGPDTGPGLPDGWTEATTPHDDAPVPPHDVAPLQEPVLPHDTVPPREPVPPQGTVPVEELLERSAVARHEGRTVAVWLPGSEPGSAERSADALVSLPGFAGADRVLVFGVARDGALTAGDRKVTPGALAGLLTQAAPGAVPVLMMAGGDRVARQLAPLTDGPVIASRRGAAFDPVEGTLTEAPAAEGDAGPSRGFLAFAPGAASGEPAFHTLRGVPWAPDPEHGPAVLHAPDPDDPRQVPRLGETADIAPAARALGIPRAGLPMIPQLVRRLRQMVEAAGVTVPEESWELLPQRLLSNYRYLMPDGAGTGPAGLLVPLGRVEALVTLDPRDPRPVLRPEPSYDRPSGLPTIPEADEDAAADDVNAPASLPGGPLPLRSAPDGTPEVFHANEAVNAAFMTGAHVQSHSGPTSATRGGVSVVYAIGVGPGTVKLSAGVSGVANAASRSTMRIGDAEGGHVLDVRADSDLLAYVPEYDLRIRTDPGRRWADVAPTRLDPADGERLMLWVPRHLRDKPPGQISATGTGGLEHRLPPVHYAAGLTGLPTLVDHVIAQLRAQGLTLAIGSMTRDELVQKVWNLDAHLDEAIGDKRGYQFQLHHYGRPVATVELHTVRASRGTRFGAATDIAHIENVRTAIDGTGGGHSLTHSSTITFPGAEFDLLPLPFKHPGLSLGWSASLALTSSNTDGHNAGRTGLWVVVPRYTGFTPAYELDLAHLAAVSVRGNEPVRTPAVPGRGVVVLPEPDALKYGFEVDEAALRGTPLTVHGEPPAVEEPPVAVVGGHSPAEGPDVEEIDELPPGTVASTPSEVVEPDTDPDTGSAVAPPSAASPSAGESLAEPDPLIGPVPPESVAVREEADGRRTVEYAPRLLRRTGRRDDDPADLAVPPHVAEGKGIGMGVVDVDPDTVRTLHDRLEAELTRLGFLPEDRTAPLADAHWWSHGNKLDSQLENHELLDKYVSKRGFDSFYDQMHQTAMVITMYKRRGALGVDWDVDAVKITIRAAKSAGVEPEFEGSTDEFHTVNLAMGMDTAGQYTGGSKKLALSFRFKVLFNQLKGSGHGFDLFRQVGATQGVSYLNNRPELLEYPGTARKHRLFSDYIVTMELRHSGLQGRLRPGSRDPAPIALPRQGALAYLLPLGDLSAPGVTSVRRTPPSVLRHSVVYHVDASRLDDAVTSVLGELTGPHGNADQELSSFAGTIMTRAHFKEIVAGQYTTDQFFDTGWFRDTFGAVDISGRLGTAMFAGATKDKFVIGVIRLAMGQTTGSDTTSHGVRLVEADVTVGGPADPHHPDGIGFVQGGADASRTWQQNDSKGEGRTGAKELIQLDFNRAYAYRTTVDFLVTSRLEKHGKLVPAAHRSDRQEVKDRTVLFLLPEPVALAEYGKDNLPVSDGQLTDVMNRWATGGTPLSGDTVAAVLSRWMVDAPELPDELDGQPTPDREALAATLAGLHDSGALPVLDERIRNAFNRRFHLALRDPGAGYEEVTLPEYLTRTDPGGRMLGHSGINGLTYDGGRTTYDIVREQVERTAPGLLASGPELWTADGRRIGRLQGGVDALQGLLADGRDVAMWEDLLSLNGQSFYLVNPVGWLLSDIVEIRLSDVLDSAPVVHDFEPATGLENYGHGYRGTSRTLSRDGAQTFTAAKLGGGETDTYDQIGFGVGEGHHRGVTRSDTAITEGTTYDWGDGYLASVRHTLKAETRRLRTAGRPLNNLLATWYRNLDPDRSGTNTVSVSGTLDLKIPRGLAEFKPTFGPFPVRDPRPLPPLPGDAYVAGALIDDALPAALKLLTRMFGPAADGATTRTSMTIGQLLSRTQLANHLPEALGGNRYRLTDLLFIPGHSGKRAELFLTGGVYDAKVLGPVKGTGAGRYIKSQSGTSQSASNDRWRPSTSGLSNNSGVIHSHDPATASDGRAYGPYTSEGDTSASRSTGNTLAGSGTENYRREQHIKQQGPTVLVRLRARLRLEAQRYNRHLLWPTTRKGTFRSDAFTGDVYVELFRNEADELLARLAEQDSTAPRGDLGWLDLEDAPRHDLSALLTEAAATRGAEADRAHQLIARAVRDRTPGPLDAAVLTLDTADLDARVLRQTVGWAADTLRADLAHARQADPATAPPEPLARYERYLADPAAGGVPGRSADGNAPAPPVTDVSAVIREVNEARARLTGDPNLPPVRIPAVVGFHALSRDHLIRDIAHELDAHVRADVVLPDGSRQTRWAQPTGHVHAFDPLDPGAPGADGLLASDQAENAGLLTPELRRAADDFGLDDADLGGLYRTSWDHRRSFSAAVRSQIATREERLEALDARLPGLFRRAVTLAGGNGTTADGAREALDALRELARGTGVGDDAGEVDPGRLSAFVRDVERALEPPEVVERAVVERAVVERAVVERAVVEPAVVEREASSGAEGLDDHVFSVLTRDPAPVPAPRRVLDATEVADLAVDVRRAVDEAFAGHDADAEGMQWCVAVVAAFRDRVFPVPGQGVSGVRSAAAVGDEALGLNRTADRLAPGAGWRPVGSWDEVSRGLAGQGPGGLAMGLTRNPFGRGHAVVAYRPRGTGGQDSAPVWVEMWADGDVRVTTEPPDTPPIEAVALVVDHLGKVDPDALEPFVASSSTQHALLDPTSDRRFGAPSSSSGLGSLRSLLGGGSSSAAVPVSSGPFAFTNLTSKYPEYVTKATHILTVLSQHASIVNYLGERRVQIVLEKRTTDSPAEVFARQDPVKVALASYYFENYDAGYVAGMLAHEFGVHPVPDVRPEVVEREPDYRGLDVPVPGLADRQMNSDAAKQPDHVLSAIPGSPRYRVYRDVVLDMARSLREEALAGTPGARPRDVTDLFDSYLMDLASIAVTNDHRLLGLPTVSGSSAVRADIATAYNTYRELLAADHVLDPALSPFLPPDKTVEDVARDYTTLAARALKGVISWSIAND